MHDYRAIFHLLLLTTDSQLNLQYHSNKHVYTYVLYITSIYVNIYNFDGDLCNAIKYAMCLSGASDDKSIITSAETGYMYMYVCLVVNK